MKKMPSFTVLGDACRFTLTAIFPGRDFNRLRFEMAKQLREIAEDLESDNAIAFYEKHHVWFWMNWERKTKRQKTKMDVMPDELRQWH